MPSSSLARSSRGLGHHPLKVAARVRIPYGLPGRPGRSHPQGWLSWFSGPVLATMITRSKVARCGRRRGVGAGSDLSDRHVELHGLRDRPSAIGREQSVGSGPFGGGQHEGVRQFQRAVTCAEPGFRHVGQGSGPRSGAVGAADPTCGGVAPRTWLRSTPAPGVSTCVAAHSCVVAGERRGHHDDRGPRRYSSARWETWRRMRGRETVRPGRC